MSFEEECLRAHNLFRAKHGVPPLIYNANLSRDANKFAQQLLKEGSLRSSNNHDLGENIYSVKSTDPNYKITGDVPVQSWYRKEVEHDYSQEPTGSKLPTGNFTQVVWKDSKELAVGVAHKDGKVVVVTRYSPAGNVRGQFQSNVLPPSGKKQSLSTALPSRPRAQHPKSTLSSAVALNLLGGDFNAACLKQHNMYRTKHGVLPLELDKKLCQYSQEWADTLARLRMMQHRSQNDYGENIFSAWSSDLNYSVGGEKAVDSWYDEIKFYTFGREPTDLKAGHFTQVVWKNSKRLGVGLSKKNGNIYVVCNYDPPGNYVGNYISNVLAPM